jgi:single-stranded-DNA-specific exonuclease
VESGGVRARAVAFSTPRLPTGHDGPLDATFGLERNEWNGAVEPRLVLRCAQPPEPAPIALLGEPEDEVAAALVELDAPVEPPGAPAGRPADPKPGADGARDRRGGGAAGVIAALVASGDPVLVVCADARARRRHLSGRLGGFALCSWAALERDPGLVAGHAHVVALDPPLGAGSLALVEGAGAAVHLVWGEPEAAFALRVAEAVLDLRAPAATLYRALRDGRALADAVGATGPPAVAGRALRVLAELGLVEVDRAAVTVRVPPARRTELERSPAFRAAAARLAALRPERPARGDRAPAPAAPPPAVQPALPHAA